MSEPAASDSTGPNVPPNHTLDAIGAVFAQARLRYALIGGHAVNAWCPTRGTDDFDFCVFPDRGAIEAAEAGFVGMGLQLARRQDAREDSGPDFVRMENPGRTIIVDLQVAKTDYQVGVIERAIPAGAQRIPVALPEDLIIMKLLAMRGRDQRDIGNLIGRKGLDWRYLEHWAAAWDVAGRLAKFKAELLEP
jgi:hypothetical protein